jgi:hypothetical protein
VSKNTCKERETNSDHTSLSLRQVEPTESENWESGSPAAPAPQALPVAAPSES